jgi:hypothetical protein
MNRTRLNDPAMDQSSIDAILAAEEELVPSSGFLATVMESVREEARTPPPIPFPWKRAIPGLLLAGGVFGWGGFELIRSALSAVRELAFTPPDLSATAWRALDSTAWVALALAVSLLCWLLSRRMAGQSGLL